MSESGDSVPCTEGMKVVVIAVDASKHAERAFSYYCEHLYREHHRVILVHSAEYPRLTTGDRMAPDLWEMEIAKKEREMKTMEEYYKDRMKSHHVPGKTRFVYHSKPGESIVHVAEEEDASLVIVGARGAGALRRTIIGSTSDYVIHHLQRAVLVCPPPPKGHDKSNYDHTEEHHEEHHEHKGLLSRVFHHHHHDEKHHQHHEEKHHD